MADFHLTIVQIVSEALVCSFHKYALQNSLTFQLCPGAASLTQFRSFADRVFRSDCNTKEVYEEGAKAVALSVVSGINCKSMRPILL